MEAQINKQGDEANHEIKHAPEGSKVENAKMVAPPSVNGGSVIIQDDDDLYRVMYVLVGSNLGNVKIKVGGGKLKIIEKPPMKVVNDSEFTELLDKVSKTITFPEDVNPKDYKISMGDGVIAVAFTKMKPKKKMMKKVFGIMAKAIFPCALIGVKITSDET